ncbi:MAG TPA: hypothetical protein VMU76_10295 [Acidimicrobiales bacterium]|nr:hypothetical protein [Acidimicrobiales bacterium]
MARWRRSRTVLLVLAGMAVLGWRAPWAGATGTGARVLEPGSVAQVSAGAVSVTTPVDGRLRGQDFTALVTGVAWPGSAGPYVAGGGRRLVVFGLSVTQSPDVLGPLGNGNAGVTAALTTGGSSDPVDLTSIDQQIEGASGSGPGTQGTGTATYVASVPAHAHDVELVVAEGSFSQRFSLWDLHRVGPSPAVLYRDPSSPVVLDANSVGGSVTIADPAGGFTSTQPVTLTKATLSDFAPDGAGTTPGSPGDAFLTLDVTSDYPSYDQSPSGDFFSSLSPLPGDRLSFVAPGAAPTTATEVSGTSGITTDSSDDGLLDATYYFEVPAATTTGTVTVTTGPVTGSEFTGFVGGAGAAGHHRPGHPGRHLRAGAAGPGSATNPALGRQADPGAGNRRSNEQRAGRGIERFGVDGRRRLPPLVGRRAPGRARRCRGGRRAGGPSASGPRRSGRRTNGRTRRRRPGPDRRRSPGVSPGTDLGPRFGAAPPRGTRGSGGPGPRSGRGHRLARGARPGRRGRAVLLPRPALQPGRPG